MYLSITIKNYFYATQMPNGLPGGVKKKKTDKTKEKHNLDNKIKWKLKEQRIKNTKQKQRNKKNQTSKQAKIYLLKKMD